MARFTTMRARDVGPAVAGLLLAAVLVIALGLFTLRISPPIHGPAGISEPAREFLHRLFPAPPLPDQHPQVIRPADAAKRR